MLGMYKAVDRIKEAIANKENILIYGDYDVDGTCSVAMMKHLSTFSPDVLRISLIEKRRLWLINDCC